MEFVLLQLGDSAVQEGLPEDAPGGRPLRLPQVGAIRTQDRPATGGMGARGAQAQAGPAAQPVPGHRPGFRLHLLHGGHAHSGVLQERNAARDAGLGGALLLGPRQHQPDRVPPGGLGSVRPGRRAHLHPPPVLLQHAAHGHADARRLLQPRLPKGPSAESGGALQDRGGPDGEPAFQRREQVRPVGPVRALPGSGAPADGRHHLGAVAAPGRQLFGGYLLRPALHPVPGLPRQGLLQTQ
ncbi:unnamed protein product, partial [Ixodes pacificus]